MRRVVTKGLYTCMEGMFPGTNFTDSVGMNEPLRQDEKNNPEGLCVDEHGIKEGIAESINDLAATRVTPVSQIMQINDDGGIVTVYPIPLAVRKNGEVEEFCIYEGTSSGVRVA